MKCFLQHEDLAPSTARTSFASTLSNNSDQQSKPRSVHFFPQANIKTIPSLKAYTPARIQKMYYSHDDLAGQRAEYAATVKEMARRHRRGEDPLQVHEVKMKTTSTVITTATTTRGLEHMVSASTLDLRQQEQRDVIGAVLLAQDNNFTPEEIALLYNHRARSACARATRQGLADAEL